MIEPTMVVLLQFELLLLVGTVVGWYMSRVKNHYGYNGERE